MVQDGISVTPRKIWFLSVLFVYLHMKKKNAAIYKIWFEIEYDNCYYGSTTFLYTRKSQHLCQLRRNIHSNPILQAYYNKYGEDSFRFEAVESILLPCDMEYLLKREQYYLDLNFANTASKNLNINPVSTAPMIIWSEERRKKLIDRNKSFDWTEDRKEKMAKVKTGTKHSEQAKQKMSILQKNRALSQKDLNNTCVYCNSMDIAKRGLRLNVTKNILNQRYICNSCGKMQKKEIKTAGSLGSNS